MSHKVLTNLVVLLFLVVAGTVVFLNRGNYAGSAATKIAPSSTPPTSTPETSPKTSTQTLPLDRYSQRLTVKKFGQYVTPQNAPKVICGAAFTGYHNGDDLETFSDEANSDVPVYSLVDGKILLAGHISGYGGLIVVSGNIGGQEVTINYGHISLSTTTLKKGDSIVRGQKLANLGKGCSVETDGERKHLHIAVHKGANVDVRGYVPAQSDLENWLNPFEVVSKL